MNRVEQGMSFAMAEGMVMGQTKGHYPAPVMAVKTIKAAANCERAEAMAIENANFAKLAATSEAAAQTGIFLADQYIKGKAKKQAKHSELEIDPCHRIISANKAWKANCTTKTRHNT